MLDISLLVAIIIGCSELIKIYVHNKFIPLVNMALGLAGSIIFLEGDIKTNILTGIMVGLTASGLFDLSKVITKK